MNYYELDPSENHFSDVMVDVTHKCNMTCKNCYIPNRDIPDLDIDKLIETIIKFPKRTMIRIVGAEPTVRKDLNDIIKRVRETGHRATLLPMD
jgi:molybdenum cofactor biosynthesis enzyme MoaA